MFNRCLRISRIIVAIAIFAVLTLALTAPTLAIPYIAPLLAKIQLIPALMAYSLFTFVVWMCVTLVFGRIYCSTVCPLGTLQDIAARSVRLRKPLSKRYRYVPAQWTTRYLFLALMLIALMIQNAVAISILDPYSAFAQICKRLVAPMFGIASTGSMRVAATVFAIVILCAAVAMAVRSGRSLCNTICPVGTTLGLVSRYAIFQIDIDTDKCINCGLCADVCKGSCIDLTDHVVDGSRCVNCFDCLPVCPNDAIHYTNRRKQLSIPMMQSISDPLKRKESELGTALNIKTNTRK